MCPPNLHHNRGRSRADTRVCPYIIFWIITDCRGNPAGRPLSTTTEVYQPITMGCFPEAPTGLYLSAKGNTLGLLQGKRIPKLELGSQRKERKNMKIPYGKSNFKKIITQNLLYIDKTKYIDVLEQSGSYNILLRPRRFGKTLFISTLLHYYDIRCKDEFDTLFGNLAIGRNPTPLKNSYQILSFDFSGIETSSAENIRAGFNRRVETALKKFLRRYGYPAETNQIIEEQTSPAGKIDYFFTAIEEANIYLLIDEYDHFANGILGESLELFTAIVGKGGFVRAFYEVIKTATMEGIVDRLFITGVTSITLDSMTSGFNICDNITWNRDVNSAMGFTAQETENMIRPFVQACELDQQEVMQTLANCYNSKA